MIRYSLFGYALASAIILIICGLAYNLFFSQKTRPRVNRMALLSVFILGAAGPLIALFFITKTDPIEENIIVGDPMIANIIVEKSSDPILSGIIRPLLPFLNYIYKAGMLVMALSTLVSVARLLIIRRNSEKAIIHGSRVYLHDNKMLSTYSWLKDIYLYRNVRDRDIEALIAHEQAHVKLNHWIDIIVMQGLLIFQWFNPAVWVMKKELEEVHEYQADAQVIHAGTDRLDYQHLLLRNLSNVRLPGMVAGLKRRSIKKRFLMMHKTDFKSNSILRGMSIVLGVFFAILLLQMPAVADVVEDRELVKKENIVVLTGGEGDTLLYHIDNKEVSMQEVANLDASKIGCVEVFNGDKKVVGIVTNEFNEKNNIRPNTTPRHFEPVPLSNLTDNTSQLLERAPAYSGGEERLKKEIYNYLDFPDRANIHGTVVVGFTVNSKGQLSDFHIVQSLDSELDILAVKAVRSLSGEWVPGIVDSKPVDVEILIPVSFSV